MDPDVRRFLDLLQKATAEVGNPYFALPIAGQDLPEYRERVYAYELYHQLRCNWPSGGEWTFTLNGEVDKSGHPLLVGEYVLDRVPDLLVHRPGDMGGNLAIIEIKSVKTSTKAIADDLRKLTAFCGQPQYRQGILLFFGETDRQTIRERCRQALITTAGTAQARHALVYWQGQPNQKCVEIGWGDEGAPPAPPSKRRLLLQRRNEPEVPPLDTKSPLEP